MTDEIVSPLPPLGDAATVAADIIAKSPTVSDEANKIESQLAAGMTKPSPDATPAAPYGYLKNGKPRKTPKENRPDRNASALPDDRFAHRADAAAAIVDTLTATLGAIFDPDEWKPTEAEHRTLTSATARYMESRNLDDLPPGVALVVVAALYAIPRLVAKEKTRGKMSALFGWARKLWAKK